MYFPNESSCFPTNFKASGAGHKDIVAALRLSKANVDAVDEYGNTAPSGWEPFVFQPKLFPMVLYWVEPMILGSHIGYGSIPIDTFLVG